MAGVAAILDFGVLTQLQYFGFWRLDPKCSTLHRKIQANRTKAICVTVQYTRNKLCILEKEEQKSKNNVHKGEMPDKRHFEMQFDNCDFKSGYVLHLKYSNFTLSE